MKKNVNGTIAIVSVILLAMMLVVIIPAVTANNERSSKGVGVLTEEIPIDPVEEVNLEDYWLYFISEEDHKLYKMETDGTNQQLVLDINASSFVIQDGWVYYYTNDEISDYCKINLDGTESTTLLKGEIDHVRVTDEFIYYIKSDWKGPMYRIDLNGDNDTLISETTINDYDIGDDGWIYYADEDNDMQLMKMKLDGSEVQKIADVDVSDICAYKDWLFFVQWHTFSTMNIYKMRNDGKGLQRLTRTVSFIFYVKDGWIYYANEDDNYTVYRVNVNSKKVEKLTDDEAFSFNIVGNWMYFTSYDQIYRSRTDGSDCVLISETKAYRIRLVEK